MMAHTPSPWTCFFKHKYGEWHVALPVAGSSFLLGIFPDGIPSENPEGDARLIAAAPDMHEMLGEAERQIEYLHEKFGETGTGNTVLACIRDVLAKAEGKTGQ